MSEPDIEERIRTLLLAAAKAFDSAQRAYRGAHPESHAAFAALVESGNAEPMVRVVLAPTGPAVEMGLVHQGKWEAFFTWSLPAARGPAN